MQHWKNLDCQNPERTEMNAGLWKMSNVHVGANLAFAQRLGLKAWRTLPVFGSHGQLTRFRLSLGLWAGAVWRLKKHMMALQSCKQF